MGKMKVTDERLLKGVEKMTRLGYTLKATAQILQIAPITAQRLARRLPPGSKWFGKRKFKPYMLQPLNWLNDQVPINLRAFVRRLLKRMQERMDWPVDAIVALHPEVSREMVERWLRWHVEAQQARIRMFNEAERVEQGKPDRKKRNGGVYKKRELVELRYDEKRKLWVLKNPPIREPGYIGPVTKIYGY